MKAFTQRIQVRWSDLDANSHMRHTAYLDMAATARMSFLSYYGFGEKEFLELGIGPVLFNENANYLKEVRGGETIEIQVQLSAMSEDGRKWQMDHQLIRLSDNEKVAQLTASGAWLDLKTRKITVPPDSLLSTFQTVPRAEDFRTL